MREYQYCQETVYVRDQYRRDGRAKSGFSLHYTQQRCRRFVKAGERFCWQHHRVAHPAADAGGPPATPGEDDP